jgi:ribosome recycling factor
MSDNPVDMSDLKRRMQGALDNLKNEFGGLRSGRASASLVEPLQPEVYGAKMPLNQVASVSVPEPRMIAIQVWDQSNVAAVEKALRESDLGLNPNTEGAVIRVRLPELNEERRLELVKVAHKYAEQARVAIRHVRRDGMDSIKKAEKDGLSEDDQRRYSDQIQKITDERIKDVDVLLEGKEKEIKQV